MASLLIKKLDTISLPSVAGFKPKLLRVKDFIWSATKMQLWRTCKRDFYYQHVLGIAPIGKPFELLYGEHFHAVLEAWYKGEGRIAEIVDAHYRKLVKNFKRAACFHSQAEVDKFRVNLHTFCGMLQGYGHHYWTDRKRFVIKPKNVERKFDIQINGRKFTGKIDLISGTKDAGLSVWDHKTTSYLNDNYFQRLNLDTQIRSYLLAILRLYGVMPKKVIYNVIQKCQLRRKSNETVENFALRVAGDYADKPTKYFRREVLTFGAKSLRSFVDEFEMVAREFEETAARGPLHDPRTWGMNDGACIRYRKLCKFHSICTAGFQNYHSSEFEERKHDGITADQDESGE